jgi:hypothetical protein
VSRPAPPDRAEIVWPRFHRKGEPDANESGGPSESYRLLRRLLSVACGLCFLGGAALYACGTYRPSLFLDEGDVIAVIAISGFAFFLFVISNTDGQNERNGPRGIDVRLNLMRQVSPQVRVTSIVLLLGLGGLHFFQVFRIGNKAIRIKDGEYALVRKERRSVEHFVRWLSDEEFLIINAMWLRRIGSGAMCLLLLPTINFWFPREELY